MKNKSLLLDLVIGAVLKLDATTGERPNLLGFIESCYCCAVRDYDLAWATASLTKLTEQEQHALIAWVMVEFETTLKTAAAPRAA
jgi:hypothetical protein